MKHIFLLIIVLTLNGCDHHSSVCEVCPLIMAETPRIFFNYIDKTSEEDLFSGSHSQYTADQLKAFHLNNGKEEEQYLEAGVMFKLLVNPLHRTDTILLRVADLPTDTLLFRTAKIGDCCPQIKFVSACFNGREYLPSVDLTTKFTFRK